jgi:NTE family protein
MITGWGAREQAVVAGHRLLVDLLGDHDLEGGRVPVTVCATDLLSGGRVEMSSGRASEAVYASSALAGILPPLERDGALLADGAYADVAPVDVARALEPPIVIAVDPTQATGATDIHNGAQAVLRAMEICHLKHAELRFREADLVIRPRFGAYIDTLDFGMRRACVLAGVRATRAMKEDLRELLSCEGR